MQKYFRVPGRLALKLTEAGASALNGAPSGPACLATLFDQTRVLSHNTGAIRFVGGRLIRSATIH